MTIPEFIKKLPSAEGELLQQLHEIIIKGDNTVKASIGSMMGKEMILYKANDFFKYGLSNVKNHMSLHIMPIYMLPVLHSKYQSLLNKASFQKGCINFKSAEEMPLNIVKQLIEESSKIDVLKIREEHLKSRKKK